jgi:hypothetical protein
MTCQSDHDLLLEMRADVRYIKLNLVTRPEIRLTVSDGIDIHEDKKHKSIPVATIISTVVIVSAALGTIITKLF